MDKPYFVAQIYLCVYRFFPFPYFRQCFRGLASIFHHVLSRVNSNVFDEASDLRTLQLPQCYQAALCRWEITADIWRSPEVRWWILGFLSPSYIRQRQTCRSILCEPEGPPALVNEKDSTVPIWVGSRGHFFPIFKRIIAMLILGQTIAVKRTDFVLPVCSLDQ